jgi:uncharacterized coiled-coil protein SlyX
MITDQEITDKCNEVKMLRLERREHCETIGALGSTISELEERDALKTTAIDALQSDLIQQIKTDDLLRGCIGVLKAEHAKKDTTIMAANETIHNAKTYIDDLEQDVTKYKTTIDELNETISDLRMAGSDMLDTINECSRREAEDSKVLMQVVEIVKEWGRLSSMVSTYDMRHLRDLLVDYLDASESPVVTLKTPSIGTRVVSKNEETHTIDETKMAAVRMLIGSDMWVLHTDEEAVEDKQQKDTTIDELMKDLDAKNTVIKDFKAIETKETDRLHTVIEGNGKLIDELNDMYCDACGKLEQIEKVTKDAISYVHIDEITKIIQEE